MNSTQDSFWWFQSRTDAKVDSEKFNEGDKLARVLIILMNYV